MRPTAVPVACSGLEMELGGGQTIKDQLDLTVPKIDAIHLILHVHEDDFAILGRL